MTLPEAKDFKKMNPYETLGISQKADDDQVRQAYLDLIRRYPPDRFPERFAAISESYQTLKDENSRLQYALFNTDSGIRSPFDAIRVQFSSTAVRTPLDFETMKKYLRKCATP